MNEDIARIKREEAQFLLDNDINLLPVEVEFDDVTMHYIRQAVLYGYEQGKLDGMQLIISSGKWKAQNAD